MRRKPIMLMSSMLSPLERPASPSIHAWLGSNSTLEGGTCLAESRERLPELRTDIRFPNRQSFLDLSSKELFRMRGLSQCQRVVINGRDFTSSIDDGLRSGLGVS